MSQESVKTALLKTMEGIRSNPSSALVVFRAETQLEQDVRCTVRVRGFEPLTIDEPPELGGGDVAMNPVEMVLAALGTCQEIMYAAYASVMGLDLQEVKVDVKGYLDLRGLFGMDASVPSGYKRINFTTQIKSSSDEASVLKLIETVESHCPVLDILARAQNVSGAVTLNGRRMHSLGAQPSQAESA